jgi:hypothetical protein
MKQIFFYTVLILAFTIGLLCCQKIELVNQRAECVVNPEDNDAFLFIKEVDDTINSRFLSKNIYQNEVVGQWEYVCSKIIYPKTFCYAYLKSDSKHTLILDFKSNYTYTFTNTDTITLIKKTSGVGRIDSIRFSTDSTSDLQLTFSTPRGKKLYISINSLNYLQGYYRKK